MSSSCPEQYVAFSSLDGRHIASRTVYRTQLLLSISIFLSDIKKLIIRQEMETVLPGRTASGT